MHPQNAFYCALFGFHTITPPPSPLSPAPRVRPALVPRSPLVRQGNVELRLQQYDAALSCFSTAADLAPGIAGYRLRAAQLLYQVGAVDGAVRTVKGVLRRNPTYAGAAGGMV